MFDSTLRVTPSVSCLFQDTGTVTGDERNLPAMSERDSARASVPWSRVAIGTGVVAVALGVSLAIVSSNNGSDTLATTALAVAIVAFAAQLIIALAQVLSDSQQARRNEEVASKSGRHWPS